MSTSAVCSLPSPSWSPATVAGGHAKSGEPGDAACLRLRSEVRGNRGCQESPCPRPSKLDEGTEGVT